MAFDSYVATARGFSMSGGYIWSHGKGAIMGIYNGDDPLASDRAYRVSRLFIRPVVVMPTVSGSMNSANPSGGMWQFGNINDCADGYDISPVKLDTNAPDMPAEVMVKRAPRITLTGTTRGRRSSVQGYSYIPFQTPNTHAFVHRAFGSLGNKMPHGSEEFGHSLFNGATIQPVTLPEGTGIAFYQDNPDPASYMIYPGAYLAEITVAVGSDVYIYTTNFVPEIYGSAAFCVMNGSGSGVSVKVLSIRKYWSGAHTPYTGSTAEDDNNVIIYMKTRAITGGVDVTPSPMSSDAALPETFRLCTGDWSSRLDWTSWMDSPYAHPKFDGLIGMAEKSLNTTSGQFFVDPEDNIRDKVGAMHREQTYMNNKFPTGGANDRIPWDFLPDVGGFDFSKDKARAPIVRPGEGLVLAQQGFTGFNYLRWELEFQHIPPSEGQSAAYGFIA